MSTTSRGPAAVIAEVRKATPPTRNELVKGTLNVLALVTVMIVVVGTSDFILGELNSFFLTSQEH